MIGGEHKKMKKDIEEIMLYYDRFVHIAEQISLDANHQIARLKGTVVADELASDFSEIGMVYARELLEEEWITREQFAIAESIDEMLAGMSDRNELWTEDALINAEEWENCRKKGDMLLKTLE